MLFASQVFVRIEIKHFLPIEFLRLPAVPINLAVIVLCPRLTMRHLLYHAREVRSFNVQQMILVVCLSIQRTGSNIARMSVRLSGMMELY